MHGPQNVKISLCSFVTVYVTQLRKERWLSRNEDFICEQNVASYTVNYTHTQNGSEYATITLALSMSTDTIESFF